jgi:hypothetical protein
MKKTNTAAKLQGNEAAKNKIQTVKAAQSEATPKNEVVIAEGLTGKQLVRLKIEANQANKSELRSFSFQVNQMRKHGAAFLDACKVSESDLTPKNLLPLRTEREAERSDKSGFSFWLIETLIKRYSVAKVAIK